MLHMRSTLSKICLLAALQIVRAQNYESEYSDGDDHADVAEDGGRPDYSKYYSVDGAAPLLAQGSAPGASATSGFVNPAEFYSGFFGAPIDFGESNKKLSIIAPNNPFVQEQKTVGFTDGDFFSFQASSPRDYFEEAQKKEQLKQGEEDGASYETKPGPSYVSHKLPLKYASSEIDEVESEDTKPTRPSKKPVSDLKKDYDHISDKDYKDALLEDNKFKVPDYSYDYPTGKLADYNVGKASSTVSQYPGLPGFTVKQTAKPLASTQTPYQKYSFQPITENTDLQPKYLQSLLSTATPYNPNYSKIIKAAASASQPQATEDSPVNLKNCAKIVKEVPEKDYATGKIQAKKMDCYVCQDPKTASKHTQCSYNSEPESDRFYAGTSERYSVPGREPGGFRYKRYSGDDRDPYEYVRSKSLAGFNTKPDQSHEAYNYQPEYYTDTFEKSSSERQSEELAKDPNSNCQKVTKGTSTCTICKNSKTGGNYEQCSYTSQPQESKYAYVTEKKYDSLDDKPEETKTITKTTGEPEGNVNKKIDDVLKQPSQKEYSKKHTGNPEPTEDYKGKRYQNKRPERDYNSNPRRGEESRENFSSGSYGADKKPSNTYQINEPVENHNDPYGYNIHKEFAESRKRLNLVDANSEPVKKEKSSGSSYDIPNHYADSSVPEPRAVGLRSSPYDEQQSDADRSDSDSQGTSKQDTRDFEKEIEEYHQKYFPEYAKEESRPEPETEDYPKYYKEDEQEEKEETKEVEEVLAEFVKKDRSNCKRAEKKGMTCYLCVDKNGIQHEECMYVSESKPRPTHIAYHEQSKVKLPQLTVNDAAESKIVKVTPTAAATEVKPLTVAPKSGSSTTASPLELVAAASNDYESRVRYEKPSKTKRSKKYKKEDKKRKEQYVSASNEEPEELSDQDPERLNDESDPTQKTPVEFQVAETDGAFSEETRPVYSKALGVTLPRYMLEKSEFEKEFDDFSSG